MVSKVRGPYNFDLARKSSVMEAPNCSLKSSAVLAKNPLDWVGMEDLHLSSPNLHWNSRLRLMGLNHHLVGRLEGLEHC